ncbi:hypothetical protein EBX31_00265 [bacterium]|nr:hypothetical protein [bacterium]
MKGSTIYSFQHSFIIHLVADLGKMLISGYEKMALMFQTQIHVHLLIQIPHILLRLGIFY